MTYEMLQELGKLFFEGQSTHCWEEYYFLYGEVYVVEGAIGHAEIKITKLARENT